MKSQNFFHCNVVRYSIHVYASRENKFQGVNKISFFFGSKWEAERIALSFNVSRM